MEQFLSLLSQFLECSDIILIFILQFVPFIGLCDLSSPKYIDLLFYPKIHFLELNWTFKALNYAVLHLSSTKPSEISFEVGFATGYALVMK